MQTKHLEKKTKKFWPITSRQRQIINKAEKLEITTIFVKKLQNTKMSIVQNSKTVYELTNKADIKSHLKHQQKILWETKMLNAIKCRGILTTIRTNSIGLQLQFAVCSCWFRVDLYTNAITVRTAKQQKQLELLYCVYVYEW